MLSNSKTKFIKDLYGSDKFFPHTVMAPRTVNCKPLQRDRVEELLMPSLAPLRPGFPRPRGDGPDVLGLPFEPASVSPPARGWSLTRRQS
jgi:hypothetical protein